MPLMDSMVKIHYNNVRKMGTRRYDIFREYGKLQDRGTVTTQRILALLPGKVSGLLEYVDLHQICKEYVRLL